jgi:hypothetical protein
MRYGSVLGGNDIAIKSLRFLAKTVGGNYNVGKMTAII